MDNQSQPSHSSANDVIALTGAWHEARAAAQRRQLEQDSLWDALPAWARENPCPDTSLPIFAHAAFERRSPMTRSEFDRVSRALADLITAARPSCAGEARSAALARERWYDAELARRKEARAAHDAAEKGLDTLWWRCDELANRIIATPVSTRAGIIAKLDVARDSGLVTCDFAGRLVTAVLRDLLSLGHDQP
jgi:hypothetical protein